MANPMASRAAEQRKKVGARPIHHLGDGHLCGKGPTHLQAEPFPIGGSGQIAGRDPCDFDHLAPIEGSKVLPDLTDVSVVIQGIHPGAEVVRAFTLSPAAGDLPFPQDKGGLSQFGYVGDVVLPYHYYESTAFHQGAGFPLEDVLAKWREVQSLGDPAGIGKNPCTRHSSEEKGCLDVRCRREPRVLIGARGLIRPFL